MNDVYICSDVARVLELHRDTLALFPGQLTLPEFLERQAQTLIDAHRQGDDRVCVQIKNWHPQLTGAHNTHIMTTPLTIEDAKSVIAREYGFAQWQNVARVRPHRFNLDFENAANAVVRGDLETLVGLIDSGLAHTRSQFGHHATLLHYVAANGVETWRQTVPYNAAEVVRRLLESGSDVNAGADMYGGSQTTIALLMTSAHPAEARLKDAIAAMLRDAGA